MATTLIRNAQAIVTVDRAGRRNVRRTALSTHPTVLYIRAW